MEASIVQHLKETAAALDAVGKDAALVKNVSAAATLISECFAKGGKILIAGNGGSAADAEHFAAEFVGRFMKERKARPALALTSPSATITAWSNDHTFEDVFARQIEAFGKPEDIFIGISTSGSSKNIVRAVTKAKALALSSITLLGNGGGALASQANITIALADTHTAHIQEVQKALIHAICMEVERTFVD